ncbi:tyrosine-type recombinase/integrase [Glycomyces sp. A-F 0318]|uniref:tyrosine-type recombinase/integrase n=1 Tax=Glycomyces amatae TaxID=2881355 RepID=UPI001E43C6AA|nr:tyrosine-type recombinase/integrase [Glycomyces amatae]
MNAVPQRFDPHDGSGTPAVPSSVDERTRALWRSADEVLADVREAVRPENTKRAYTQDWAKWQRWATLHGRPDPGAAELAHPLRFVEFAAWLWENGAPAATVRRRLAGAAEGLRAALAARHGATEAHRLVYPGITADAQAVLAAAEKTWFENGGRTRGAERGSAPVITVTVLRQLVDTCGDDAAGLRDRALLTLAYSCLSRRSEQARLQIGDVTLVPEGIDVDFWTGKSRASRRTVAVPYGRHRETCPVRSWTAWLDFLRTGATPTGPGDPAWRQVNRWGHVLTGALSAQAIGDMVTRRATEAGLALHYTAHGLRAGLATDSSADDRAIARRGGWAEGSRQLGKYRREKDRWNDNPATDVGL